MPASRPSYTYPPMKYVPATAWLLAAYLASVAEAATAPLTSSPFAPPSQPISSTLFTRIAPQDSGLIMENRYDDPLMWGDRYTEFQTGAVGTGLAAGDLDGDGLVDLYVVSKTGPNKVFRQTAPFQFEDVSATANAPGGSTWGTGATMADIDNDGDLDIYACQFGAPNLLYLNDGRGRFTEGAAKAGIGKATGSVVGAFADYDRDGDLDLFLLTNVLDANASPAGEPDYLFRNNGDGTFTDVTRQCGILDERAKGHSAIWWDANGDGWPDLYVSNDFAEPDRYYRNNGDGTFTELAELSLPHTPWYSMGADFGDINNDGLFDLLAADMASTTHYKSKVTMGDMGGLVDYFDRLQTPQYMKNAVYLNSGTHRFQEVAKMTGLSSTDWTWSPRFEDFDNDGWLDLHVTNGMVRSFTDSDLVNKIKSLKSPRQVAALVKRSPVLRESNLAFRNEGGRKGLHFSNATDAWGLTHEGVSFGSIVADFDNDGDLDLAYANYEDTVSLFRNDTQARSIVVELIGTRSNRFGIGAEIEIASPQGRQVRMLGVARGTLSSSQPVAHFGLGSATAVSSLTVRWPSGVEQSFADLAAGRRYTIKEPEAPGALPAAAPVKTELVGRFREQARRIGLDFRHQETPYNDMVRQPLLPHRMSELGGGIAVGDADGDRDVDIYFAGAAGQVGALYRNDGSGHFVRDRRPQPWDTQTGREEMAPLFIDVNGDGQLDLYVTSGSVEADAGDPSLGDRLYLNRGEARFEHADPSAYPIEPFSASVATAADLDRDGDLDLFVGGRVIPGQYPQSPRSVLLENRNGRLVDATVERAPGLAACGLVTAALWSDIDSDGWSDLIVLAELEPIRIFANREGTLEVSESAGRDLARLHGFWNSIAAIDVENDGDLDYAVGNLGLNTKYKASHERPFRIYYHDFEGSGTCNIVEAKYEGETLLPVRGRSCSSLAMPSLARKFPTFHDFGMASLETVYGPEKLEQAISKQATELASGILVNDGRGRFSFQQLPRMAQAAPTYGIGAADFDGDGNADLALAQNFYGPQVETGRYNGSIGLLLLGDGQGGFSPASAKQSGILIEDEARGLAVADLNADGWPDVLASRPNNDVMAFVNQPTGKRRSVAISLRSAQPGNPQAIGARLLATFADGSRRVHEIASGSGYLSQSEPAVFLGYQPGNPPVSLEVAWPDGSRSTRSYGLRESDRLVLAQTDRLALWP